MIKIGLTGSIAMGKSTVLQMFADLGAATWSADEAVHRLYGEGGAAVAPVAQVFPDTVVDGAIDRKKLARLVLGDHKKLKALEAIVHPLVARDRQAFLNRAAASGASVCVFDIPLLFESGGENTFDAVIVVSAPASVQRDRALARLDMTPKKLTALLAQQMSDEEKRARADYVISTAGPLEKTRENVKRVFGAIRD